MMAQRKFAANLLLATLLLCVPTLANSAPEVLAYYEITAEVEGNSTVIRTSKPVEFGTPITHEFGEYQIHMVFEPSEASDFILTFSLNAITPTTNALVYTMLSDSFQGQINSGRISGQSAFTIAEGEIDISIVLRLTRIQ